MKVLGRLQTTNGLENILQSLKVARMGRALLSRLW